MSHKITGKCMCGKTQINSTLEKPPSIINCYCEDCYHHLGNYAPWVACPKEKTTITGPLQTYKSSEKSQRQFCGNCGAIISMSLHETERIMIPAGLLDNNKDYPVIMSIFEKSKKNWSH